MSKLAVIGASYLQLPLVKKAKEMGLTVICFAWADGAVCKDLADAFYPISVVDKDAILEVCLREKIDGIATIASDVAAPTVAYVAEKMGLPGNSCESALKANNKHLMRDAFLEGGIPCPAYRMVKSADESVEIPFPLIVKPSDRSGSMAVSRVDSPEELRKAIAEALAASFAGEAMVEQCIEGREISVEFISCAGRHYPLQITDKVTTGAPHFVELEHHQPARLSASQYKDIYALTSRALDALGITDGASHTEYKITRAGEIYIMETGARMGGDFIGSDLVYLSTGYDFLKGVIDVALGRFTPPRKLENKAYSGVYFLCGETERLLPVFGHIDGYPQIVAWEKSPGPLKNVTRSADRSGYFIYVQSEGRWEL